MRQKACRLSDIWGHPWVHPVQPQFWRLDLAKARPGFMQASRAVPLRNTEVCTLRCVECLNWDKLYNGWGHNLGTGLALLLPRPHRSLQLLATNQTLYLSPRHWSCHPLQYAPLPFPPPPLTQKAILADAVSYETYALDGTFDSVSIFKGVPNEALDAAWAEISGGMFQLQSCDLGMLNARWQGKLCNPGERFWNAQ